MNLIAKQLLEATTTEPLFIYHPDPHDADMLTRLVLEADGYRNWYGHPPEVIYIYKAAWDGMVRQARQSNYHPALFKTGDPSPWQVSEHFKLPEIKVLGL